MIAQLIATILANEDARTQESISTIAAEELSVGLPWITGVEGN